MTSWIVTCDIMDRSLSMVIGFSTCEQRWSNRTRVLVLVLKYEYFLSTRTRTRTRGVRSKVIVLTITSHDYIFFI